MLKTTILLALVVSSMLVADAKKVKDEKNGDPVKREVDAHQLHNANLQAGEPTLQQLHQHGLGGVHLKPPKALKPLSAFDLCKQECRVHRDQGNQQEDINVYITQLREELKRAEEAVAAGQAFDVKKPKTLKVLTAYDQCKQECKRKRDEEKANEYVTHLRQELNRAEEALKHPNQPIPNAESVVEVNLNRDQ